MRRLLTRRWAALLSLCLLIPGTTRGGRKSTDGSDIGVRIMGTIAQKAIENNVALVKTSGGQVMAVKPGFTVNNDTKILEIHEKYMIVSRSGQEYLVYQDKFASEFQGGEEQPYVPPSPSAFVAAQPNYREDGFERNHGEVKMTAAYRNKLVNEDMARVLMQATAEPYMQGGQIAGFQLSQIDPGSIYDKGGLKDSDVITSINGQKLNNVAGAIALLRSLKDAKDIDVDIIRGGSPSKLQLKVD